MTGTEVSSDLLVPPDIADTVISPAAHRDDDAVHRAYAWLRENLPIGMAQVPGYPPVWLVTRHADIDAIARDRERFPHGIGESFLQDEAGEAFLATVRNSHGRTFDSLNYMDEPEHSRVRGVAADWFAPGNVKSLEAHIRAQAVRAVDRLAQGGGSADLVADFAMPYPLRVIMSLFGIPPEDEPFMLAMTHEFFGVRDPDAVSDMPLDTMSKAFTSTIEGFYSYFDRVTEQRRACPTDDLASMLANARLDGDYLDRDYLNGYYISIATAGHDTTSGTVAGALLGLARFPDQLAAVQSDPALIPGLVNEGLRWADPVKHHIRGVRSTATHGGIEFHRGDRLMLCWPAGNRDEREFPDPDRFDVTRRPNRHLSYGRGRHTCIGLHVAQLEMRVLFEELIPRLKDLHLAGKPTYKATNFVGGLNTLPATYTLSGS
jgi:alpha-terpineol hydroxylase